MNATIDNMTIAQLKKQLTAKNVKFSSKTKRETLVELLQKHMEESAPQTEEFPEAKVIKPTADPMEQAASVIQEIVSNKPELDTLTRGELLSEVAVSMGEEFVQENRKKLVCMAVEIIQQEMDKRTNTVEKPQVEVAKPKTAKKSKAKVVEPTVEEPTKKSKTLVSLPSGALNENLVCPDIDVLIDLSVMDGGKPEEDETIVEVAKPKKAKKSKAKAAEPEVAKPNLEEMTLAQIREYMSANGMDKQLGKLNAILINMDKSKKKTTKPRQPSVFNLFMKEEMASLKETNPEMNHRELFSMASSNWKTSAKNPKNHQE